MKCKVPLEAQHFFDTIDTEEKAYWLGFIVADGHIYKTGCGVSIELSKTDEDHLKKVASIFSRNRKLKNRETTYYQCSIYLGGKSINQSLRKLGLTNKKSEELVISEPEVKLVRTREIVEVIRARNKELYGKAHYLT